MRGVPPSCADADRFQPSGPIRVPAIAGGGDALAGQDAATQIEFIHRTLLDDGRHAKAWWIGWVTFLSAAELFELPGAIVGNVVPVPPRTPNNGFGRFLLTALQYDHVGLYEGSVTTAGGIASLLFTQAHAPFDGTAFDLRLRHDQGDDPCALLAEGERLLLRDAHDEAVGQGVLTHVLNAAVNVTSSLILGILLQSVGSRLPWGLHARRRD